MSKRKKPEDFISCPTTAEPGSRRKLAIIAARIRKRQPMDYPGDIHIFHGKVEEEPDDEALSLIEAEEKAEKKKAEIPPEVSTPRPPLPRRKRPNIRQYKKSLAAGKVKPPAPVPPRQYARAISAIEYLKLEAELRAAGRIL
ncbi:MAG: hypothetical protein Q8P73_01035 [bacterium]|nr:hypothetical protein [bacterium]MDZ4343039.1 hypothetical protein [Candidatus Binatia bacterium]